jgi:hypothetical protein
MNANCAPIRSLSLLFLLTAWQTTVPYHPLRAFIKARIQEWKDRHAETHVIATNDTVTDVLVRECVWETTSV